VGQTGESYGGINSYRAAAAHPPHLVAIAPVISWKSPFDEIWYKGGIRSTVFRWWPFVTWGLATPDQSPAALASMAERAAAYETDANAHPTHDAYWQAQEVDIAAVDRSDVAVLGIGGWGDLFPKGMVDNYRGARDQSWLLMFPHAHVELGPGLPGFPPELDHARLAWFDRWLAGRADAPLPASKVTSWEMPRDGGRWRQLADLPDRPAGEVLQLTGTGALAVDTGPPTSHTYTVNPFDTSCACSDRGGYTPPAVATDQQVADRSRLHFDTGPLAAPVVVAGNPEVHLRIALSAADTNLVVHLEDIGPDGRAILMTSGWLRASFRESAANPAPLEPGRPYDITVQMWPTHWRVPAGHGLRLSITSGDLNSIEPNAPPGSVTLLVGDGRSTLTVPTIAS
jgi:putative CocE/NonD family hydrolase